MHQQVSEPREDIKLRQNSAARGDPPEARFLRPYLHKTHTAPTREAHFFGACYERSIGTAPVSIYIYIYINKKICVYIYIGVNI